MQLFHRFYWQRHWHQDSLSQRSHNASRTYQVKRIVPYCTNKLKICTKAIATRHPVGDTETDDGLSALLSLRFYLCRETTSSCKQNFVIVFFSVYSKILLCIEWNELQWICVYSYFRCNVWDFSPTREFLFAFSVFFVFVPKMNASVIWHSCAHVRRAFYSSVELVVVGIRHLNSLFRPKQQPECVSCIQMNCYWCDCTCFHFISFSSIFFCYLYERWQQGAHINPAVTFGMAVMGAISPLRAAMYIIGHCGGGIAGAALLYG